MNIVRQLRTLNEKGFDHFFVAVFVVVIFGIIGSAYLVFAHAANAYYYDGICAKTTISLGAKGTCVQQGQILLDALQHQQSATGHSYRTATGSGAGVFRYGNEYYLVMNGDFNSATETAVHRLYGKTILTGGSESGSGWQVLCRAAAQYGFSVNRGPGANALVFHRVAGEYTTSPTYVIFNNTCGSKVKVPLLSKIPPKTTGNTSSTGGSTGASTSSGNTAAPTSGMPTTRLGIYTTAEDNSTTGAFSTYSGQKPDVANMYQAWDQGGFPTTFVTSAEAAGATPFIELEPWHMGPSWNQTPSFNDIIAGKYDSWLRSFGSGVKANGKPIIFTFAHEFNVSGQYPWAEGDTGSCGSSSCSPSEWVQAWDHVESVVNSTAGGHAYWMWVPNADTGGSTQDPMPWWPGSNEVQMVGVDGYPDTQWGAQFGTFSGEFGPVFNEIHTKTHLPIFIAETDLAPLGSGSYESIPNFIHDLFANGGDGILEWEDGAPKMSSAQWAQLDAALAAYPN